MIYNDYNCQPIILTASTTDINVYVNEYLPIQKNPDFCDKLEPFQNCIIHLYRIEEWKTFDFIFSETREFFRKTLKKVNLEFSWISGERKTKFKLYTALNDHVSLEGIHQISQLLQPVKVVLDHSVTNTFFAKEKHDIVEYCKAMSSEECIFYPDIDKR